MKSSATIGVLDGVHLGHQALLERLRPTMQRTVLTFEPHPIEVLSPGSDPRLITDLAERVSILKTYGVDEVVPLDLAAIKEMSPQEFIDDFLVGQLGVGHLVVGADFRFGRDRTGDVALLSDAGAFEVEPIELVANGESTVSSSRIRALISDGNVSGASALLSRPFSLANEVIHGDKRGREIGFPTANLRPPSRKVIPGIGVYACFAEVRGQLHQAAVNVGYRPTFDGKDLLIEAFVLDFDEEIYGEEMRLHFVDHLRPELRFDSVEELVETMRGDVARARSILNESSPPNMS